MKQIEIDDVMCVNELPVPFVIQDEWIVGICPFCGKEISKHETAEYMASINVTDFYMRSYKEVFTHVAKEECKTPKYDFILKKVRVHFSFESIQETFKSLGIELTEKVNTDIQRL